MSLKVCLVANTLTYPEGGGHLWVYLNWALGLRAQGCEVIWLERVEHHLEMGRYRQLVADLKTKLARYGLAERVALCSSTRRALPPSPGGEWLDLDAAAEAELVINLAYDVRPEIITRFRRSVLVDIDPGLLQVWVSQGAIRLAPHTVYFSISEAVGQRDACFPDLGLSWHHTPPPVALDWWPVCLAPPDAPFSTVTHWGYEWAEDHTGVYRNNKRDGFLPFLDLPSFTTEPLELAVCMGDDYEDEQRWKVHGWRLRPAYEVTSTPWDYQRYLQQSRGEFSCVKPSCVRLQNSWISDRTICYLASGKPAIVEHTGPSRILPAAAGLFRFHDLPQAIRCLESVAADYPRQCRLARALAEEYFDAKKVSRRVLERALN